MCLCVCVTFSVCVWRTRAEQQLHEHVRQDSDRRLYVTSGKTSVRNSAAAANQSAQRGRGGRGFDCKQVMWFDEQKQYEVRNQINDINIFKHKHQAFVYKIKVL